MQTRLYIILFVTAVTGCAGPLLRFSTDAPATLLAPVHYGGISDKRSSFRTAFCNALQRDNTPNHLDCAFWLHRLSDEVQEPASSAHRNLTEPPGFDLLFVPGIFWECVRGTVTLFGDAIAHLEGLGYRSREVPVRGRASSGHNAKVIRDYVVGYVKEHPAKRVLLIAYSKGVPDSLMAIEQYPEIRKHIAGIISIAGVVGGTPIADSLAELYESLIGPLPYDQCPVIDGGELQSLTRHERSTWLASHRLPMDIRLFSLVAMPSPDRVSAILKNMHTRLAATDPRNDSQVVHHDAVIPGSVLLGYANADHWAIALPFETQAPHLAATLITRNQFPRAQLLEAAIRVAEEDLQLQATVPGTPHCETRPAEMR